MKPIPAAAYRRQVERAMSEREFMRQVVQIARLNGFWCWHDFDARKNNPGFPDLVLAHAGRGVLLWRELKRETGKTTDDQERVMAMLRACGQDVAVWRPSDWDQIVAVLEGAAEGMAAA